MVDYDCVSPFASHAHNMFTPPHHHHHFHHHYHHHFHNVHWKLSQLSVFSTISTMSDRVTNCMYPKEVNFAYAESIGQLLVLRPHPDVPCLCKWIVFNIIVIIPLYTLSQYCQARILLVIFIVIVLLWIAHFLDATLCRTFAYGSFSCPSCVTVSASICIIFIFNETTFDKYVITMSYRVSMHER